jgi:hypothetical protein
MLMPKSMKPKYWEKGTVKVKVDNNEHSLKYKAVDAQEF